jgi:hypothetical protein
VEITLLILIAIGLFWYSSMQARERGVSIAQQVCTEIDSQLLDETILLCHIGLKRDRLGQLRIRRIYTFRYVDNHNNIQQGTLILLGKQQESLLLDTQPNP